MIKIQKKIRASRTEKCYQEMRQAGRKPEIDGPSASSFKLNRKWYLAPKKASWKDPEMNNKQTDKTYTYTTNPPAYLQPDTFS